MISNDTTPCVTQDGFHCEMQMTDQIAVIPVPQRGEATLGNTA